MEVNLRNFRIIHIFCKINAKNFTFCANYVKLPSENYKMKFFVSEENYRQKAIKANHKHKTYYFTKKNNLFNANI